MLLGCDVRIGADIDAKIGLNEVGDQDVLPDWAFTISQERLSPTAHPAGPAERADHHPRDAVEVGFLDEVVPEDQLLDRAVDTAAELAATLDPSAYARTVEKLRGPALDTMAEQVANDRAAGNAPTA